MDAEEPFQMTSMSVGLDRHRIAVSGDLDIATSPALLAAARAALVPLSSRDLVVDLSRVRFLDASAVGVLVEIRAMCRGLGGRLTVFGATGLVAEVLQLTGVAESLGLPMRVPLSPDIDVRGRYG